MQLHVNVTSTTQKGNEVLGTNDKTLYYLILGEGENKTVINVGEKTFNNVKELLTKSVVTSEKKK